MTFLRLIHPSKYVETDLFPFMSMVTALAWLFCTTGLQYGFFRTMCNSSFSYRLTSIFLNLNETVRFKNYKIQVPKNLCRFTTSFDGCRIFCFISPIYLWIVLYLYTVKNISLAMSRLPEWTYLLLQYFFGHQVHYV